MILTPVPAADLAGLGDGAATSKLVWWPGDIRALAQQTDTEITSLSKDFDAAASEYGAISYDDLASFNTFYNEWRNYFDDEIGIFAYLTGSTVGTLQTYRQRAEQWRKRLVAAGARTSTPELPDLPTNKPSPWTSTLKWVSVAAIAVAAVYGVSKVVGVVGAITPARTNPRRRRRSPRRRR